MTDFCVKYKKYDCVPPCDTKEKLKACFNKVAMDLHPDKHSSEKPDVVNEYSEKFIEAKNLYKLNTDYLDNKKTFNYSEKKEQHLDKQFKANVSNAHQTFNDPNDFNFVLNLLFKSIIPPNLSELPFIRIWLLFCLMTFTAKAYFVIIKSMNYDSSNRGGGPPPTKPQIKDSVGINNNTANNEYDYKENGNKLQEQSCYSSTCSGVKWCSFLMVVFMLFITVSSIILNDSDTTHIAKFQEGFYEISNSTGINFENKDWKDAVSKFRNNTYLVTVGDIIPANCNENIYDNFIDRTFCYFNPNNHNNLKNTFADNIELKYIKTFIKSLSELTNTVIGKNIGKNMIEVTDDLQNISINEDFFHGFGSSFEHSNEEYIKDNLSLSCKDDPTNCKDLSKKIHTNEFILMKLNEINTKLGKHNSIANYKTEMRKTVLEWALHYKQTIIKDFLLKLNVHDNQKKNKYSNQKLHKLLKSHIRNLISIEYDVNVLMNEIEDGSISSVIKQYKDKGAEGWVNWGLSKFTSAANEVSTSVMRNSLELIVRPLNTILETRLITNDSCVNMFFTISVAGTAILSVGFIIFLFGALTTGGPAVGSNLGTLFRVNQEMIAQANIAAQNLIANKQKADQDLIANKQKGDIQDAQNKHDENMLKLKFEFLEKQNQRGTNPLIENKGETNPSIEHKGQNEQKVVLDLLNMTTGEFYQQLSSCSSSSSSSSSGIPVSKSSSSGIPVSKSSSSSSPSSSLGGKKTRKHKVIKKTKTNKNKKYKTKNQKKSKRS